jgi:hypothetical protein
MQFLSGFYSTFRHIFNIQNIIFMYDNYWYNEFVLHIVIMPKYRNKKAYILEFKNVYTTSHITAEEAAKQALDQINEKKYETGVRQSGVKHITKIGLGFKGKQ